MTHQVPCHRECAVVGELDPDLEHALRAWWVDYAYSNYLDEPDEQCPCCQYRWEADDDSARYDPYLERAQKKYWDDHLRRKQKLLADERAAARAFWELVHERTGWLSTCGGAALVDDVRREALLGIGGAR